MKHYSVCRVEGMGDGDEEEQQQLQAMLEEARSYLQENFFTDED
ncbi:hypothetical protein [Massilia sp. Root351]|jgi:hypothetical protein|nr:hypothetical protein [Massilia sp. Root351]